MYGASARSHRETKERGKCQYRIAGIRVCVHIHAREVTRLHSCRPRAKKTASRHVSTRENATLAGLLQQNAKKACKVNGGNFQDSVNWPATFKGKTIKNYCPWVHKQKNPGTYCKQKQNNVLVSTACPCACAGY
jgi:hypothetical protein